MAYKVGYGYVKHGGLTYFEGELLPPDFTERDKFRNIYASRIIEISEEEADEIYELQGDKEVDEPVEDDEADNAVAAATTKVVPPKKPATRTRKVAPKTEETEEKSTAKSVTRKAITKETSKA